MEASTPILEQRRAQAGISSSFRPAHARWALIVATVVLLELLGRSPLVNATIFVPPSDMLSALVKSMVSGEVWGNLVRTALEIGLAFFAATTLGLGLSFLFWRRPTIGRIGLPFVVGSYAVPHVLFYPVLLVILGLSIWPIVLIATAAAIVPVILNGWVGLTQIREVYLKTAASFSCPRWTLYKKVVIPAAAPMIFAGLKMGFVYSTIGVVAMEFVLSDAGLGWLVKYNYDVYRTAPLYGFIVLVVAISFLSNSFLLDLERRIRQDVSGGTMQATDVYVSQRILVVGIIVVAAVALLIWQAFSISIPYAVAPPLTTMQVLLGGFTQGWIVPHATATLLSVALGVAIAVVSGTIAGLALGTSHYWGTAIEPILLGGNAVPKIVLFPVFVLIFGIGMTSKIAIGAVHGFFPATINTMAGARELDPVHTKVGRSLLATRWQMVTKVFLPSIALPVVTGMRMAFSLGIIGVILAELFTAKEGLGLLVRTYYARMQWPQMYAVILFLFLVSFAGNGLFWLLERRLRGGR